MNDRPLRMLLVEDDDDDCALLRALLRHAEVAEAELVHVDNLSNGLSLLNDQTFDIILLDLALPDSTGNGTLQKLHEHAPDTAIVVLTGLEDEAMAMTAIRGGAQDYIVKGQTAPGAFRRALSLAVERQRITLELRRKAFRDELTGLNNRFGFLTLGAHQLKVCRRTQTRAALFYVDFDGLKFVNDSFGHSTGDDALRQVARLMQSVCRESDVLGRIGGDEFVILTINVERSDWQGLAQRLDQALRAQNRQPDQAWPVSVSYGISCFDPAHPAELESLLMEADQAMYDTKRTRRVQLER